MVTDVQVEKLEQLLKDTEFKRQFDEDPVAAARGQGMAGVAAQFEAWLANREQFERDLPETEAHGLGDKLNATLATKPRLALLLLSSAVAASALGGIRY